MSEIITIDKQVRELIAEHLNVNPDQVTDAAHFTNDLGGDSLDQLELLMQVEDEFDIEIPDAEGEKLFTARAVIDYVTKAKEAA